MKIGITCYPTYGGSGVVATELVPVDALSAFLIYSIETSRGLAIRGCGRSRIAIDLILNCQLIPRLARSSSNR
jgi:hypothetical protein